jgi:hypothetical protein
VSGANFENPQREPFIGEPSYCSAQHFDQTIMQRQVREMRATLPIVYAITITDLLQVRHLSLPPQRILR